MPMPNPIPVQPQPQPAESRAHRTISGLNERISALEKENKRMTDLWLRAAKEARCYRDIAKSLLCLIDGSDIR